MKIKEELVISYAYCLLSSNNSVKILADALQQAVAENLKLEHEITHGTQFSLFENCWRENGDCHKTLSDWLAEADKLLRGEK